MTEADSVIEDCRSRANPAVERTKPPYRAVPPLTSKRWADGT